MSNQTLKEHYERKYAHEQNAHSIESIEQVKIPTDRLQAAVKFLPKFFHGGDVLEIGAGTGSVAKACLNSDMPIDSYTLGDISLPRVEGIRKNLSDSRLLALELDAEEIPTSEHGKYDAVIMIALVEHLVDPIRAMTQVRKLLKPQGFVYLDTPNIAKYTQRLKLLRGRFPSTGSTNEGLLTFGGQPTDLHDEGHLHYFTYRSLSLMLTQRCGFSEVRKLAYPGGRIPLGKKVHNSLAKKWPEMFSELALVAMA
jgi:SAM-dependent methyltransferase